MAIAFDRSGPRAASDSISLSGEPPLGPREDSASTSIAELARLDDQRQRTNQEEVRRTRAAIYERRAAEEREWQARRLREAARLDSARIEIEQREKATKIEMRALEEARAAAEAGAQAKAARQRAYEEEMAHLEKDNAQYHMAVGALFGAVLTVIASTAGYVLFLHPHIARVNRASLRAIEEHNAMRDELTRVLDNERAREEAISLQLDAARETNAELDRALSAARREAAKRAAASRAAREEQPPAKAIADE